MRLPLFQKLNRLSIEFPGRTWSAFCGILFAMFLLMRIGEARKTEVSVDSLGEIALASLVLATVLFLFFRFIVPRK